VKSAMHLESLIFTFFFINVRRLNDGRFGRQSDGDGLKKGG
jgi:hypothetical protein